MLISAWVHVQPDCYLLSGRLLILTITRWLPLPLADAFGPSSGGPCRTHGSLTQPKVDQNCMSNSLVV